MNVITSQTDRQVIHAKTSRKVCENTHFFLLLLLRIRRQDVIFHSPDKTLEALLVSATSPPRASPVLSFKPLCPALRSAIGPQVGLRVFRVPRCVTLTSRVTSERSAHLLVGRLTCYSSSGLRSRQNYTNLPDNRSALRPACEGN